MICAVDKVSVVLVLKEGPSNSSSTIVHVAHVLIERRNLLNQIFFLSYIKVLIMIRIILGLSSVSRLATGTDPSL